jgi:hypothetical protein
MANQIQSVNFFSIAEGTTFSGLNSISILNLSADAMYVEKVDDGTLFYLNQNQSVSLSASTGFVLPDLILDSTGTMNASVITT